MCRTVWRVIASETCKNNNKVNSALDLLVSKSAGSRPEDRARAAATTLNQYYVDTNTTDYTAQTLRIALAYLSNYLGADVSIQFEFKPFTLNEMVRTLKSIKKKKSCDINDMSTYVLDYLPPAVISLLLHVINQCVVVGTYPDILKIIKIQPIYKGKGEMDKPKSYRPISLIPIVSKVFEKLLGLRLMNHFTTNKLLNEHQYAYQCGRSTSDAARDVISRVMNHLEGGRQVAAIFCDLSRAFEMVDHTLLLEKLARYGVDGGFYSCLQSFLSNRKQSTCVSNIKSDFQPIGSCAVPQGSVMGNNMFVILVNDITAACRDVEYVMFADDTCILVSAPDIPDLKIRLNLVMKNIYNWFTANGMMLNVDKTHIMQFKLRSCNLVDLNITLNDVHVPQATQVKYLGFLIDAGLSWTPHIDSLCDRLSSACYALSRLSHSLSEINMRNAYYGYFHSVLTYGIVSWAMAADRGRVFKLQKRAVRTVCNKPYDHPAKELFRQTKILTLTCAYVLVAAKIIRKNLSNLQTYAQKHNRNTRGRLQLYAPPKRLAKSRKSVEILGIKIYNALPDKLKNVESDKVFISQLKRKLQNMACYDLNEFFHEIGSSTEP
ncbi:hypothetical protein O0L34_g138 [Tuta absoluta]|nr:hypothetical protein O0L34_g138 [Tuta absoluta]